MQSQPCFLYVKPVLTHAYLERLSQGCLELYKPNMTLENFSERTFSFLSKLVPSDLIAFGSLDETTKELDIGFNSTVPGWGQAMESFGQVMGNYDLFNWNPEVNDGRPFCRSDFYSEREFRDLDVYKDVYQVLGIDNHCAVYVPSGPGEVAFYGIERCGGPDFTEEERDLLAIAQTHLGNARDLVLTRSRMGDAHEASPELLVEAGLTVREADVLFWISEGKSNDEIALLLHLQLYTVKGYVKTIFQKIGVPNRLAAALWALRFCWRARARTALDENRFVRVPMIHYDLNI